MEVVGDIFIFLLLQPMLNGLVLLYSLLFDSMALAIIALTVVVRVAFYPLTIKQLQSSAKMQAFSRRCRRSATATRTTRSSNSARR